MNQSKVIAKIRDRISRLDRISDGELKSIGLDLKYEAMAGRPIKDLMVEGFALVVERCRRELGLVHHDVQLMCGIEMAHGRIAEMKTGEGKTLTAALLAYLGSLYGRGMHVVTANDYLATRDEETLGPVFRGLGISSASLYEGLEPEDRKRAYQCDITFGSAKEFGFDFLRDRMAARDSGGTAAGVMRELYFALVDEADSILIDEARTPLIIGLQDSRAQAAIQARCTWAAQQVKKFKREQHYSVDEKNKSIKLTQEGKRLVRVLPETSATGQLSYQELNEHIVNALTAANNFHLDKQYAVQEGKIVIIDELTGRPAPDRQWQKGIHQAIEAKEGLDVSPVNRQAATVTIQTLFNRYTHLCGMTGTIYPARKEIRRVYGCQVTRIPTHRPVRREPYPTRVYGNEIAKYEAIADEVQECIQAGRAVLVGTRNVRVSELLSAALHEREIAHSLLNARYLTREAEIVAEAGQPGRVTVATNMAGRGTDVKLHDSVREAGGRHVILSELHESTRIDWQLIGRGSRQGDPGSYRIYSSFEDEILELGFGTAKAASLRIRYCHQDLISQSDIFRVFLRAQAKTERRHLTERLMARRAEKDRQKSLRDAGVDCFLNTVDD